MAVNPVRMKRKDCFWGLHFDFHAQLTDCELGKNLTQKMIETIIAIARPDYIQCDCKGHPGIASYQTEVGVPAGGFLSDPLKLWREVTAEKDVLLLVHYSGVWDFEMVKRHPEWARKDAGGNPSDESTSTFGHYAKQQMIPQLKEICERYEVDGVWIDGDCWGVEHDYSEAVVAAFRLELGYSGPMPQLPGDHYFVEWSEFNRESFRAYVRTIASELHQQHPDFQIASNWAFSSFMPEPVSADVDFLSGDLDPQDSVNSARLEARVLAGQKLPWDLMSWSVSKKSGQQLCSTKSDIQMMQEAAIVISLGGGFQLYMKQRRDASVPMWMIDTLADVERFCRERQPWCQNTELIPQVGLLLSRYALYQSSDRVFGPWGDLLHGIRGTLRALLESGHVVDIVMEHTLEENLEAYPLIVIPEWGQLEEAFKDRLLDYTRKGGKLLLVGPHVVNVFANDLGFGILEQASAKVMWLRHEGKMAGLKTTVMFAEEAANYEEFGRLYDENDTLGDSLPAASIIPYEKGTVGCVWFQYGEPYVSKRTSVQRDFLGDMVKRLMPDPRVEVHGSHSVDVVFAHKDERLIVHLINTSGPHADPNVSVFDELMPIGPLQVVMRNVKRPACVRCQPGGKEIPFDYEFSVLKISGITVAIHDILVVEF